MKNPIITCLTSIAEFTPAGIHGAAEWQIHSLILITNTYSTHLDSRSNDCKNDKHLLIDLSPRTNYRHPARYKRLCDKNPPLGRQGILHLDQNKEGSALHESNIFDFFI